LPPALLTSTSQRGSAANSRLDSGRVGDVAGQGPRPRAAGAQLPPRPPSSSAAPRLTSTTSAAARREGLGAAAPEASARAGDHYHLPVEIVHDAWVASAGISSVAIPLPDGMDAPSVHFRASRRREV
jgi:hypothetical protein